MFRSLTSQPISLWTSTGVPHAPLLVGSYHAFLQIRQTTTTAAGIAVFAMRLATTTSYTAYIRRIALGVFFDGTAAAKTQRYDLMRFSGATHTAGTAVTSTPKDTGYPATAMTDIRFLDTGLTDTSVVYEAAFGTFSAPISVTAKGSLYDLTFEVPGEPTGSFQLAAGEGLAIQLTVAAVVGATLQGWIEWDER